MSENRYRLIEDAMRYFCWGCGLFMNPVVIETMDYGRYEVTHYECGLCGHTEIAER